MENVRANPNDEVPLFWLKVTLAALSILCISALIGYFIYMMRTLPTGEERATHEARCHAAMLNDPEYPAYSILKAGPRSCQVMIPEGGLPLLNSWFECRYTGEKVVPCVASSTIPWPPQGFPEKCITGRQEWQACTEGERNQWRMWMSKEGQP